MGKNNLMIGSFEGVLNVVFSTEVETLESIQTKKRCEYVFKISEKAFKPYASKSKALYDRMNRQTMEGGSDLKDAIRGGIIRVSKDNKLFFRGRYIIGGEGTLNHIIGNAGILIETVPSISFSYFDALIKKDTSDEEKLILFKTLLQAMGWGSIVLSRSNGKIELHIKNPPRGLQAEKDNWDFLANTILGYLWTIDKDFKITKTTDSYRSLFISYAS